MQNTSDSSKIRWLVNRFQCMTLQEAGYRVRQALTAPRRRRIVLHAARETATMTTRAEPLFIHPPMNGEVDSYAREADAILRGEVPLFAQLQARVAPIPDWNRLPVLRLREDGASPAAGVASDELGQDVRVIWELNRHLQWVRLAQAWVLTEDPAYRDGLAAQIASWLEQCPPLQGANWTSALELAMRLVNWSVVWQLQGGWDGVLFRGETGERLRVAWMESIRAHCLFVSSQLSRHSSANNHLTGELAGLYVAARTWRYWQESAAWARQARAELEREARLQHFADGGNREQAFAYQAFTLECLMIAGLYGWCTDDAYSDDYWRTVWRACGFLHSVRDSGGHLPRVGDADDGAVLRLEPLRGATRASIVLELGNALFSTRPGDRRSDTARWLLGEDCPGFSPAGAPPRTDWRFPDSGYYLFGTRFGQADEIKGMVDCGPLGYLGIAAHGHADALGVWLSIAGEECLVDAGTYTYGGEYRWRAYFRGTSAHNTLRVDGTDQSVAGGRFMWTHKARVNLQRSPQSPGAFQLTAEHDGYRRLRDPVRHVRSVTFDEKAACLTVRDEIEGHTEHAMEQFWHFAPHVQVALSGSGALAVGRRFTVNITFSDAAAECQVIRGDEALPLGWMSRGYGVKEPASVLRVRRRASKMTLEMRFAIQITATD
jgi:hypothetical protein